MTWVFPLAFTLFFLLAVAILFLFWFSRQNKPTLHYSSLDLISKKYFSLRVFLSPLPLICKILALVFIILALARPQTANEKSEQNVKGIDIMLVMDISLSMLVRDMSQNSTRLEISKKVVSQFIQGRVSDRIGLIVFSGESFTSVPLTLDYNLILEELKSLEPIPFITQGTAIGVALANAVARLKNSSLKSRVIIFLTDGENNTGFIDPETALKIVKNNKIKIYTVGLGTASGRAPVILPKQMGIQRRVMVDSRINKKLMMKMAKETGGKFFMAKNLATLQNIFQTINALEKQEISINKWTDYKEHFPFYLTIGIVLYFLSMFLSLSVFFKGV